MTTNIEWVQNIDGSKGYVWNPAWGCLRGCPYCYARKIAKRFYIKMYNKNKNYIHGIKDEDISIERWNLIRNLEQFKPTWLESNFQKKFPKKPKRIFVNSMSDICYWKLEWMNRTLEKIKEYPQHIFLFLTKDCTAYEYFNFPDNCWLGVTITNQASMNYFASAIFETTFDDKNKIFISMEPIQEEIKLYVNPDWLIIGAETGNRKDKIIPEKSWIANLLLQADKYSIPIFMKDNLKSIWQTDLIQEFPE